jgi:hypothetical protein
MISTLRRVWARLVGRRPEPIPIPIPRPWLPRDPAGCPASGQSQHLLATQGDPPFVIRATRCLAGAALKWHSTDTSVARLEVSTDTRSAQVMILSVGHSWISVSDGENCELRVVSVSARLVPAAARIGLRIDSSQPL